jgi:hypothetical protein
MQQSLLTLLIDDDKEIFLMALKEISPYAQCVLANDGIYALEELMNNTFKPDIIFIDIDTPGMNGIQCLTEKSFSTLTYFRIHVFNLLRESPLWENIQELAPQVLRKRNGSGICNSSYHKSYTIQNAWFVIWKKAL